MTKEYWQPKVQPTIDRTLDYWGEEFHAVIGKVDCKRHDIKGGTRTYPDFCRRKEAIEEIMMF